MVRLAKALRALVAFVSVASFGAPALDACLCGFAGPEACCDDTRVARADPGRPQLDVPPCCCCRVAPGPEIASSMAAAVEAQPSQTLAGAPPPSIERGEATRPQAPSHRIRRSPGPAPPWAVVHRPVIVLLI